MKKKKLKKKITIIGIFILLVFSLCIFINNAFFKPTKLNAFIAAKIYKSPANIAFTDDGFYKCVIDSYNGDNPDKEKLLYTDSITDEQLKSIEGLSCNGFTGYWQEHSVGNIDGIELMTNLKYIDLWYVEGHKDENYYPTYTLDLTHFSNLEDIRLHAVYLKEIIVGNKEKLEKIDIDNSGTITLSGNYPLLTDVSVTYTQINQLNLDNAPNLQNLLIQNTDLQNVNLSNNTKLSELDLTSNELNSIDLSNNAELVNIKLGYNQIQNINVSNNDNNKVSRINIHDNKIQSIDLSNFTELTDLSAYNNQIREIDLSDSTKLTDLDLSNNLLSSMDLSNNSLLKYADLNDNQLDSVNVSNCVDLIYLNNYNNKLQDIDLTKNTKLIGLRLHNNQLVDIDLSNNTELTELNLGNNNIKSLDLTKNTKLISLSLHNNQLVNIDLSNNVQLTGLNLGNNNIKNLDLSNNINLITLQLNDNEFIDSPLNSNLSLTTLNLSGNMLTELDLTDYTTIKTLYLNNSKNLKKVLIDDVNQFTALEIEVFHKMIGYPSIENVHETVDDFLISEKSLGRIIVGEYRWYQGEYVPPIGYSDLENFELNIKDSNGRGGLTQTSYEVVYGNGFDRKIRINYEFHIPSITSDKYKINKEQDYIYTQTDTKTDVIKENITSNYGTFDISDNQIHVKYEDYTAKSLNLLNYSIKDFPYTTDAYGMYEYIYIPNEILYSNEIYNKIECNGCYVNLIQNDVVNDASEQIQIKANDIIEIGFEQAEIKEQYQIKYINNNIPEVYNIVLNNDINKDLKWYKGYDGSLSADISLFYSLIYENIVVKISKDDVDLTDKFNVNIDGLSNTKKITISNKDRTLESGEYDVDFIIDGNSIKNFKFNIEEPILVSEIDIENITLLSDNKLKEINYTINPIDATNKSILFEIDDESIAVIENEQIKGLKQGETTLTLKTTDGSNIEKTIKIKVVDYDIKTDKYNINNLIISKIKDKLIFTDFIKDFTVNSNIITKVFNNDTEIDYTKPLGTGYKLKTYSNDELINEYTLIVSGDLDGNGSINAADIMKMKMHILGKNTLENILFKAGDIDENNSVNATDIIYLKRYILGKSDNVWGS